MKKIQWVLFAVLVSAAVLLVFGCSKKNGFAQEYALRSESYYDYESDADWEETDFSEGPASLERAAPAYKEARYSSGGSGASKNSAAQTTLPVENTERKLVKRANIRIRVENLDAADNAISGLMEKYGAYSASTVINDNSHSYSVRVPSPEYGVFLAAMDGMGRTLQRSESAEDVTLRYYDLEGRLATKKELLKTFQSYLGKAKNIEEILSVEARIADLQSEIEGTGKELRNLANKVDFATIELTIYGPVDSTPYRGPTIGERIQELFNDFGNFLSVLAVILVGIVIYGIPTLLLLVFFFWILFGKIGLLRKLFKAAAGKKRGKAE